MAERGGGGLDLTGVRGVPATPVPAEHIRARVGRELGEGEGALCFDMVCAEGSTILDIALKSSSFN